MSIWFKEFTVKELNLFGKNSMSEFLDIQFTEVGNDFLTATMPVNERTKQPFGLLHGGANMVLAETIASVAANGIVDPDQFYCVGLDINANHIRSVKEGVVTATTTPIHLGRATQVWHISILNEAKKQTCIARMTAAVVSR